MSPRTSCVSVALVALLGVGFAPSCTQGEGTGAASGTLDVFDCWTGSFNLHPDFFAAVPSSPGDAMQIRIENGGDYETFSDGIAFLCGRCGRNPRRSRVRRQPASEPSRNSGGRATGRSDAARRPGPSRGQPIDRARIALFNASCRTQNVALYAMSQLVARRRQLRGAGRRRALAGRGWTVASDADVVTDADLDGTPVASMNGADASVALATEPGAGEAGPSSPTGTSTIVFSSLFDGNPAETNAQQRLSDAQFDLDFADPREVCPGGLGPPPRCRGHLTGYFRFDFENGQPAQPFP